MNRPLLFLPFLCLLAASACRPGTPSDQSAESTAGKLNWPALAQKLVDRADLQAGEKVFLLAEPGRFDPLVTEFGERAADRRAIYLGTFSSTPEQPEAWATDFTRQAGGMDTAALQQHLQAASLGIMMPGPTPDNLIYALMQDNLRKGTGRTIHFHWSGAYDLNGDLLPDSPAIDSLYQRAVLETDYGQLARDQRAFETAIRQQRVTVTTPAGTNISFRIGDRPVTRQEGDASLARMEQARNLIDREIELPAGAVRVAPIEESVDGIIVFPDADWNGEPVRGVSLVFRAGKVTEVHAEAGRAAVLAEMEKAGPAGRSFREFALGFNPLLAIPESDPMIPYYGYGSGLVRLSLGDNTELGGKVGGGYVRWNFFPDATVYVGDEAWVVDGQMVERRD